MTISRVKEAVEHRHAWAIDTGEGFLLPASYFLVGDGCDHDFRAGAETALFLTREIARDYLASEIEPRPYPYARIVRVIVRYEVVG